MRLPKGLTLIELTATMAITGVLVASALSVATRLSRADAAGERLDDASLTYTHLENLLERDVIHAVKYRNTDEGVRMALRSSLDAGTLELEHLRSTVSYETRQIAGRRWLLRIQETPDKRDLTELVLPGVRAVGLKPVSPDGPAASGDWRGMPEVVVFRAEFIEAGRGPAVLTFRTR